MNNRIDWIDSVKFYALLFVILGHHVIYGINIGYFWTFHMPLFFWVNGYLWKEKSNFLVVIRKAIKNYIVPYIFGSMFAIIFCRYLREKIFVNCLRITDWYHSPFYIFEESFYYWRGWSLLWFLPCLFIANILFFLLLKVASKRKILMYSLLCVSSMIGVWLSCSDILLLGQINNALVAIVFMYAGYIYSHDFKLASKPLKQGAVLSLVLIYVVSAHKKIFVDMGSSKYPFYPICILAALGGIIVFVYIVKQLPCFKMILFFGKNSLIVYLVHAIEHNFIPWSEIKEYTMYTLNMKQFGADILLYVIRVGMIMAISAIIIGGINKIRCKCTH